MAENKHTAGPWVVAYIGGAKTMVRAGDSIAGQRIATTFVGHGTGNAEGNLRRLRENESNARLIAAAPDLLEAAVAYAAWMDRENNGRPDYGQLTRDTHPQGEAIWRKWYDETLDMCQRAQDLNRAAIARATQPGEV